MAEVITELFEMCGQSKDEGRKILVKHTNKVNPFQPQLVKGDVTWVDHDDRNQPISKLIYFILDIESSAFD